jgi:hypothetical protein
MTETGHKIYLATLASIVVGVTIYLALHGSDYYVTSLEERFYHQDHQNLKPSGMYGHGLGIIGTLLILIGVFGYMARKRFRSLGRIGVLKYWLEFHIFLCTLGPIMILFHTAFKFGGIVSISFWSMVAVVASGVIGRFIYLQIPRTIQGRELSLVELQAMSAKDASVDQQQYSNVDVHGLIESTKSTQDYKGFSGYISQYLDEKKQLRIIRSRLNTQNIPSSEMKSIMLNISNELNLNRKIQRLLTMQKLFRYWHIAHLPFALIMLIIMIIHVAVTLTFGYTWIF